MKTETDRRRMERFETLNLLTYFEKDPSGTIVSHGIAKTLDLSESGALIEIPNAFKFRQNVEIEIALEENLIRAKVEIIEQKQLKSENWKIRLRFENIRPNEKHRLASFIHSLESGKIN